MLRFQFLSTRNHLLRAAGLIVGVVASGTLRYSLFGLDPIDGGVANDGGTATAPDSPGIGAVPDQAALGQPLAIFEANR